MERSRPAPVTQRPRYPAWFDSLTIALLLVVLFGAYIGIAHLTVIEPDGDSAGDLNTRDAWYFALHAVVLLIGAASGALLALAVRRSVMGFVLVFAAILLVAMVATQVGTFKLACEGHNDIVRHWQC